LRNLRNCCGIFFRNLRNCCGKFWEICGIIAELLLKTLRNLRNCCGKLPTKRNRQFKRFNLSWCDQTVSGDIFYKLILF
jgi:hypothetical protein